MIIDWLSYTLGVEPTQNDQLARDRAKYALYDNNHDVAMWYFGSTRSRGVPRRPYAIAYKYGDAIQYVGSNINHTLIELPGQACNALRRVNLLDSLMRSVQMSVTRVDVAFDLLDVEPDGIVANGYSERFRTHSRIASDTGITHYVGSPKSERYARVYKYSEPHPRAHLCRIEIVHRKRYAKILAKAIVSDGLASAGLAALASYAFQHESVPKTGEGILEAVAIIKGSQQTVRWLIAQVSPAFKRLVRDGTIADPEAFFRQYFLP
jgi:DNA relaxase NicK